MFENNTYDAILERALRNVPSTVDKREGSIIFDAISPVALELANIYMSMDSILNEAFADTASREYLIKRAKERGLEPYEATYAVLKGAFNCAVSIGSRFNLDKLNYIVTEIIDDTEHTYKLQCEISGSDGNRYLGKMTPIGYIDGLTSAELIEVIVPGEDDEDTEVFRKRYINSLQSQAFGGNIADYKEKVLAINGVGGVKVYRAEQWNGAGTVKLVIQDSDFSKPSTEFIDQLQTQIDPVMNSGEGIGLAPIGHQVTVVGVNTVNINITANITYSTDVAFNGVKSQILGTISKYFKELNADWADNDKITVFSMQIGARLLNIKGIIDVKNIKLNNSESNVDLSGDEIINVEGSTFNNTGLGGGN